jgi:hypothetical protein
VLLTPPHIIEDPVGARQVADDDHDRHPVAHDGWAGEADAADSANERGVGPERVGAEVAVAAEDVTRGSDAELAVERLLVHSCRRPRALDADVAAAGLRDDVLDRGGARVVAGHDHDAEVAHFESYGRV